MNNSSLSGDRLWDEILKAIVDTMPAQLFPLFREIFGKNDKDALIARLTEMLLAQGLTS